MTTAEAPVYADLEPLQRLGKDIKAAAALMGRDEARFSVDQYYNLQDNRMRTSAQITSLAKSGEPNAFLTWELNNLEMLEATAKKQLGVWAASQPVGAWALSIAGIGPVIAAGLLAHIDIEKAPTVGHIWRFAGLDPTVTWGKGQKRPWNARLKVLCWKAGESFVKVQSNENDVYGKVYVARKALEMARNESGAFKEQAVAALEGKKYGKDTEAYKAYAQGRLPQARIHLRATRYAVKLFLSSLHEVMFFNEYKTMPPLPYILQQPGHSHYFTVPHADLIPGLPEAIAASRTNIPLGGVE